MNRGIKTFWNVGVICLVAFCCFGEAFGSWSDELRQAADDYNKAIGIANGADQNNLHAARNSYAQAINYLHYSRDHYNRAKEQSRGDMLHGQICRQVDERLGQLQGVIDQLQRNINTIDENLRIIAENERRKSEADAANSYGNRGNELIAELNEKDPRSDLNGYLDLLRIIAEHFEASANHWRAYPHNENADFQANRARQFRHRKDAVYHEQIASQLWDEAEDSYSLANHDHYVQKMGEIATHFSLAAGAYREAGAEDSSRNALKSQNVASASHYHRTGEKLISELKGKTPEANFEDYLEHVYQVMAHFNMAVFHWGEAGNARYKGQCEQKAATYRQKLDEMLAAEEGHIRDLDEAIANADQATPKNYAELEKLYNRKSFHLWQKRLFYVKLGDEFNEVFCAGLAHEAWAAHLGYDLLAYASAFRDYSDFIPHGFFEGLIHGLHTPETRDNFSWEFNNKASQVAEVSQAAPVYGAFAELVAKMEPIVTELENSHSCFVRSNCPGEQGRVEEKQRQMQQTRKRIADSINGHWSGKMWDRVHEVRARSEALGWEYGVNRAHDVWGTLGLRQERAKLLEEEANLLWHLDHNGHLSCASTLFVVKGEAAEIAATIKREEAHQLWDQGNVNDAVPLYYESLELCKEAIHYRYRAEQAFRSLGLEDQANGQRNQYFHNYEEFLLTVAEGRLKKHYCEQIDAYGPAPEQVRSMDELIRWYRSAAAELEREGCPWYIFGRYHVDAWRMDAELHEVVARRALRIGIEHQSSSIDLAIDHYADSYRHSLFAVRSRQEEAFHADSSGMHEHAQNCRNIAFAENRKRINECLNKRHEISGTPWFLLRKKLHKVAQELLADPSFVGGTPQAFIVDLRADEHAFLGELFYQQACEARDRGNHFLWIGDIKQAAKARKESHYYFVESAKYYELSARTVEGVDPDLASRKRDLRYEAFGHSEFLRAQLADLFRELESQGRSYEGIPYLDALAECMEHEASYRALIGEIPRKHFCLNIGHYWAARALELQQESLLRDLEYGKDLSPDQELDLLRSAKRYTVMALERRREGVAEFYRAGYLDPIDLSKHEDRIHPLGLSLGVIDEKILKLESQLSSIIDAERIRHFYQDQSILNESRTDRKLGFGKSVSVSSLSGQRGVLLEDHADCSDTGTPWASCVKQASKLHKSGSSHFERAAPVAGYGESLGASPLYVNQTYRFSVNAGTQCWLNSNASAFENVRLLVKVYDKTSFDERGMAQQPIHEEAMVIPLKPCRSEWEKLDIGEMDLLWEREYLSEGGHSYSRKGKLYLDYGLETFIGYTGNPGLSPSGGLLSIFEDILSESFSVGNSEWIIAHRASSSKYAFIIEIKGFLDGNNETPITVIPGESDEQSEPSFTSMYALDFSERLPWQLSSLHKPSLEKQGKAPLKENTRKKWSASFKHKTPDSRGILVVPSGVNADANYDSLHNVLGGSPSAELRQHGILNAFVEDMGRDPLALATYVQNEIKLIHATNSSGFNPGEIERSALGVFLEKQGSAWEQCALLVYLLRHAGYKALYAMPSGEGLEFSVEQLSQMLTTQLDGQLNWGKNSARLAFPWVVFQDPDTEEWIDLFPWIKSAHIEEGLDLYPLMPEGYNNALSWVRHYLENDPEVMKHVGAEGNDTAGVLFTRFVAEHLSRQGLSMSDVGAIISPVKTQFASWDEFPKPMSALSTWSTPKTYYDLREMNRLFPKVSLTVSSIEDPNKRIETGELKMCDVQNRRLYVHFTPESNDPNERNHRMHLELASYDGSSSGQSGSFDSGNMGGTQEKSVVLGAFDQSVLINIRYPKSVKGEDQFTIQKGVLAGICLNLGSVTHEMLEVLAQQLNESGDNPKEKLSATAYLTGMAYYEKLSTMGAQLNRLHKVVPPPSFAAGLSKLSPEYRRGSPNIAEDGAFIGTPKLYYPQVDMHYSSMSGAYNDHLRADLEEDRTSVTKDLQILWIADGSSNEHQVINEFFNQKHAISTAKLLQLAHKRHIESGKHGTGFLVFTRKIFELANGDPDRANRQFFEGQLDLRTIRREAGSQWQALVEHFSLRNDGRGFASDDDGHSFYTVAFMTPGNVHSDDGHPDDPNNRPSYTGMGTLLLAPTQWSAMISSGPHTMNGGFGQRVQDHAFESYNMPNINVDYDLGRGWSLDGVQSASDPIAFDSGWGANHAREHILDSHWEFNVGPTNIDPSWGHHESYFEPAPTFAHDYHDAQPSYADPFANVNQNNPFEAETYHPFESTDSPSWQAYLDPILEWANSRNAETASNWNQGGHEEYVYVPHMESPHGYDYNPHHQDNNPHYEYESGGEPYVDYGYEPDYDYVATPQYEAFDYNNFAQQYAEHGYLAPEAHLGSMQNNAAVGDPINIATGTFYIDEVDISVPGPFELEIRRNYSSKNPLPGEYGFGWKRNIVSYLVLNEQADNDTITAAEMDGTVIVYRKLADKYKWVPLPEDNLELSNKVAKGGVGGFNPFQGYIDLVGAYDERVYTLHGADGSTRDYHMKSFPISETGVQRNRPYLRKWIDARGNYLTFAYGEHEKTEQGAYKSDYGQITRIESNTGSFLVFKYNDKALVSEARSSDGRSVKYHYSDWSGDLEAVQRPDNTIVKYTYQKKVREENGRNVIYSTHRIVKEEKPEGRILENVYDEEGRVTEQRSTVGPRGERVPNAFFEYVQQEGKSEDFKITRARDARGQMTEYHIYKGFIYKVVDPLGYVFQQAWYLNRNTYLDPESGSLVDLPEGTPRGYPRSVMYEVDKRGLKTSYTYDVLGNVVHVTLSGSDLTGTGISETAIRHSYIPGTTLLYRTECTDASGRVKSTVTTYDETYRRLPATITEFVGDQEIARRTFEYGSSGNAQGLLVRETSEGRGSSYATDTVFEYNAQGFPVKKQEMLGESDLPRVTEYVYNKRGQCSKVVEPFGATKSYEYDVMGRLLQHTERDRLGKILLEEHFRYNQNGEVIVVDGPQGSPLERTMRGYDKAGRLIFEALSARKAVLQDGSVYIQEITGPEMIQSGAYTSLFEYDSLGNLHIAYDPNGNRSEMEYDALNRLQKRSKAGFEEYFEYEPGGNVTRLSDNAGREVLQEYTTTGLLKYRKNADGTEDFWSYDLEGRVIRESLAGVVWTITYDDLAGTVTRHCEATGENEVTTYDYLGNEIELVDAKGNRFEKHYDHLGRLVEVSGPEGLHTTYAYLSGQNRVVETNALGETVDSEYDVLGRLVTQYVNGADGTTVQEVLNTYNENNASVITAVLGEKDSGTIQQRYLDTRGNAIAIVETVNEVTAITRFEYDAKGNCIAKHSPEGQTYRYAYDAFDRLVREIRPDGSAIEYEYDLAGNLTHRHMPGGLTWTADYNAAGQRTGEVLRGGDQAMRAFGYTYENGLLKTKADPRGLTFEYAYDDARRIKHIRAGSDTTAYDYDLAGNIRRIEQRSGEDVSVLEHTYNVLGLLEDEVVTLNGSVAQSWHQTWNAAGRRTDLTLRNAPENGEKGSDRTYAYDALGRMTMASNNATGKSTYTHAAHGLSTRRTPWITQAVDEKQTQPSGLVGQINTYVSGQDVLFERLSWRKDHKLAVHILQRKGNVKTQHTYHYDTLGQLEKDIYTYPGLGVTPTYTYGYDPLGVLTNVQEQGNINGNDSWSTDLDALHRISQETLEIEKDAKLLLEGDTEVCVRQVHVSANGGERVEAVLEHIGDHAHWKAYLSHLKLGDSNRIKVTATSEEDVATDHVFEKLLEPYVSSDCDALGNLKSRRNALTGERTDYTWDVWGRLVHVLEHGHDGVMRSWTYRYDALGRRLETTYQGEKTVVIKSFYDPEYEYLELGMSIQSGVACHTIWKQYGPDSSGYYGELNGIGGLEGVINGKTGDSMGAVNDITGNIAAYTYHGQAYFLEGNVDNYGRLSGDEWLTEDSEELEKNTVFWVLKNSRFRGRRVEGNNLSYFGARYYNTETGNFLSPDPYGHDGSLDLYSYASADPVNYVDPDGRLSQPINQPLGSSMPQVQADVPKQGFYQKASSFVTSKLDHIQTFLDVAGMTPGIGNIADIANAAISGSRGNWAEMGLNMAAAVPGIGIGVTAGKLGARAGTEVAHSSMSGLKLNKSIASQAQMSEVGTILAGSGARTPFRDAGRVAEIYGGKATDWVKKTSSSYLARDGMRFESHWVENIKTGQRVEFKTKF